jgi:TonB family protein
MSDQHKKKKFLDLPRYIGDRDSFREFVRVNLKYPAEAMEKGIEGVVHLWYVVNDNGRVLSVEVEKGLGYGCDEEAERLVRLMRFSKVKNRGLKVTSRNKARIEFKMPPKPAPVPKISYEIKPKSEPVESNPEKKEPLTQHSYTITIKVNSPGGKPE